MKSPTDEEIEKFAHRHASQFPDEMREEREIGIIIGAKGMPTYDEINAASISMNPKEGSEWGVFREGFGKACKWLAERQPKAKILSKERAHQIAADSKTMYDCVVNGFAEAQQSQLKPITRWYDVFSGIAVTTPLVFYTITLNDGKYKLLVREPDWGRRDWIQIPCEDFEDGKAKAWEDYQERVKKMFV